MSLVKKISVAKVVGDVKKMVAADKITEKTAVMRVIGVANGIKTGTSEKGDWAALTGQFKATNLLTGEQFVSGTAFMPDVALDLVAGQLNAGDTNAVEFGFDIEVVPDETSVVGYVYQASPLIDAGEDSTLARLEKSIGTPKLADASKGEGKTAAGNKKTA